METEKNEIDQQQMDKRTRSFSSSTTHCFDLLFTQQNPITPFTFNNTNEGNLFFSFSEQTSPSSRLVPALFSDERLDELLRIELTLT